MTNEEKQLLLKDLCAMLPYGVKGMVKTTDGNGQEITDDGALNSVFINEHGRAYVCIEGIEYELEDVKPYLRPMSSMTEEEEKEYIDVVNHKGGILDYALAKSRNEKYSIPTFTCCIQWLLGRHFDVNNLIPMNLALPAPEGMYKID